MKKLMQLSLMTFTLLATSGVFAAIVDVKNNTKGKVKFSVDAGLGGKNDIWVDPGTNESHDTNLDSLKTVKIRYYPANESPMLSYDKTISSSKKESDVAYSVTSTGVSDGSDTYYWTVTLTNNSPYIAVASWDDGLKVIEPSTEDTIKAGAIKLFEKEGNPVALTKDDLNKKTLEINGSEAEGFSLQGSGSSASDSSRTYKNNTDNWVIFYSEGDPHLLKGADAQGNSESGKNVDVRIYTKEKGSIDFTKELQDTESSTWVIDNNGDINPA